MADELLTAKEAAAVLKITLGAFYALRRRHAIPNRGIGRSLRFRRSDLERAVSQEPRVRPQPSRDWLEALPLTRH